MSASVQIDDRLPAAYAGYLFVFVFVLYGSTYWLLKDCRLYVDEGIHYDQIQRFYRGEYKVNFLLTVIPGYHAIQAFIGRSLHTLDTQFYRFINVLFMAAAVLVFYACIRDRSPAVRLWMTAVFATFPCFYPYIFLIYTDVLSMLFLLLTWWAHKRSKFHIAPVFFLMACLVRQLNIVWGLFFVLATVYEQYPQRRLREIARHLAGYGVCFCLFIIFYVANGGVAVGDKMAHPGTGVYSENVFFFLFSFVMLCLPLVLLGFRKWTVRKSDAWLYSGAVAVAVVLYITTFRGVHPYNLIVHGRFVHNDLVYFFRGNLFNRLVFLALSVIGLMSWLRYAQANMYLRLVAWVAVLSLIPTEMIEFRYGFTTFCLFFVFTNADDIPRKALIAQVVLNVVISSVVIYWIKTDTYFP